MLVDGRWTAEEVLSAARSAVTQPSRPTESSVNGASSQAPPGFDTLTFVRDLPAFSGPRERKDVVMRRRTQHKKRYENLNAPADAEEGGPSDTVRGGRLDACGGI